MAERSTKRVRVVTTRTICVSVFLLAAVAACRQGVPVIDPTAAPSRTDGTISGTVRGPEGTSAVTGRTVQVVNIQTGERQKTTTSETGGFTFKVPPGSYRVELTLLEGEVVVKRPSVIKVNRSDVDAHADFVLRSARLMKPRWPRLRGDDGLGSPIA